MNPKNPKIRISALTSGTVIALSLGLLASGCSPESTTGSTGSGGATSTGSGGSMVTGSGGMTAAGSGGTTATGTGGRTVTGSGGSTVTGTGGSTVTGTGGSTVTGTGGSTVTGTGGSTVTGTGGATAGGLCLSATKTGSACTAAGTSCGPKACGIGDLGRTMCDCAATLLYTCRPCEFSFPTTPPTFPTSTPPPVCALDIADKVPCATKGQICSCDPVTSVGCVTGVTSVKPQSCLCWITNTAGALIWDCDSTP